MSSAKLQAWSELLSPDLLDSLQAWNDAADEFYGPRAARPCSEDVTIRSFWMKGSQLAERVQEELGPEWEVLYKGSGAWWTWVLPPSHWDVEPVADDPSEPSARSLLAGDMGAPGGELRRQPGP